MSKISKEKQRELVNAAQHGDTSALHTLIDESIPYVRHIADKEISLYISSGTEISKEDVYHEGILGLIEAVDKYKLNSAAAFSSYAYLYIAGAVKQQIRFELNRLGLTGTDTNITGISLDDNNGLTDCLTSDEVSAIDELILEDEKEEVRQKFNSVMSSFSDEEKKILYMLNGIGTEKTSNYKKIANEMGMSEIMVRKIVNEAMRKISITRGKVNE